MNDDNENFDKKKFLDIKKSSNELAEFATEEALRLTDVIHNQETNIKDLNDEKILFERNEIQIDIQKNQQLLINEYKENNDKLNSDLNNLKIKIEELDNTNKKFLVNNNELKNTLSRYIKHNKNLQISIDKSKKIESESLINKSLVKKMSEQIIFYQSDNSRLSSEIINIQKKYETIKNNFNQVDKEKNNIFKQIQDLNYSLTRNNIVGTPFDREIIEEDTINSKVLNDISKVNSDDNKESNIDKDLDKEINDIFN